MTYLERILNRQSMLALRFEGETAKLPEPAGAVLPEKRREADAGEQDSSDGKQESGAGERQLFNKLTELSGFMERTRVIRQQTAALQEQLRQGSDGAVKKLSGPDDFGGGLVTRSVSTLQSTGIAGYETRQSMEEISRFFERDSRRYGGV